MTLPQAIICDLDGTLALLNGRYPFGTNVDVEADGVNRAVADVLRRYQGQARILLVSGREDALREATMRWLTTHGIPHDSLWMRPTRDNRKDAVIKQEIFETHIKGRFDVLFVLDDRNQVVKLWRELGLTCFQVAEGDF